MQRFQYILMLLAIVGGMMSTRTHETSTGNDEQRSKPIAVVRIVDTAEAQYFSSAGRYGSLDDLRSSGVINKAQSMFPDSIDISRPGQPLPGFLVRLTVSDDKKGYQLSVTLDTKPFLVGFFSDERGLIYEGHPLQ